MNLCINKLASKIWERIVLVFYIHCIKLEKSQNQHFPFILDQFSFVSNAMNFFIHSLNRFVLYLRVADFLQSGALYATITHDPQVNITDGKVSIVSVNKACGSGVF